MKKFCTVLFMISLFQTSINAQVNFNNQVIVYFKSGVQRVAPNYTTATISSTNVSNVLSSYGIPVSNVVPSFPTFNEADTILQSNGKTTNGLTGEESRQMNRAKVFTITVTNPSTKINFINSLNTLSEVLYAESNGGLTTNLIPVDGRFNQQWGMRNLIVPNADIHAVPAWDIFTGNPNAIIAVIDNGVDRAHDDLAAKIDGGDAGFIIQTDELGRQFSHGSHVAGIAAAITNNAGNNGVAGVDWQARIHPKNIFDGNGDPDITQSIIDAVNFNANVWTLNDSWGMLNQDGTPGRYSVTVRSAFAQAYRNNRVQCVAMGNHQRTNPNVVAFPAGFNSGIIAVGATDINDNIGNFSAQGAHIDVSAPGVGVWSTNFNNGYIDLTGTSMATPHVAGLASLLKGFNTNLANDDIEQIIRLTADDELPIGFDNAFGTGRINALRALQSLQAPNTLQQLSTTSGTIFSTSGSMTRIFLGVPGLADAAYIVKRSEVRKTITLPAMCNTIGVWGRGVGTTGYREENGRNFGEGICEVVPGTLTNTGCTLRTWIYEVWSASGQYIGFYPKAANNVVFQYTILGTPLPSSISGDDVFCTTSNNYSIPNLPNGATVSWSTNPTGVATPNSPNSPQTTLTKINSGSTNLVASIANACGTTALQIIKPIKVGAPTAQTRSSNVFTTNGYATGLQECNVLTGQITPGYFNGYVDRTDAVGTSFTWTLQSESSNAAVTLLPNPDYQHVEIRIKPQGASADYKLTVSNACGSFFTAHSFRANTQCPIIQRPSTVTSTDFTISPNPTRDYVRISSSNQDKFSKSQGIIYGVKVIDRFGVLRKTFEYKSGIISTKISITDLNSGVYLLSVFDGQTWKSKQLIVEK